MQILFVYPTTNAGREQLEYSYLYTYTLHARFLHDLCAQSVLTEFMHLELSRKFIEKSALLVGHSQDDMFAPPATFDTPLSVTVTSQISYIHER